MHFVSRGKLPAAALTISDRCPAGAVLDAALGLSPGGLADKIHLAMESAIK